MYSSQIDNDDAEVAEELYRHLFYISQQHDSLTIVCML